ncbi:GPI mannosyltransferase 4 isoform X2 [Euwallacea fornicatus]|uniref:GPI mannosyltransferase 4 isoform X2 n=1 Tax=Euwallacea fornicatus TaxID=995702 RepID=UPI00338DFFB7
MKLINFSQSKFLLGRRQKYSVPTEDPISRRRKSQHSSNIIYYCLGALRVLLVLTPQNGYIHPDEYFQSVEVLAGKIFDVEYSPPWEFNATQPIRVYLHSEKILPEVEIKIPDAAIQDKKKEVKKKFRPNKLLKLWLLINALLTFFYGFVHQGGVFPAMQYLHKDLSFSPKSGEFHIVTSGIYSLPQSFFLQKLSLYSYNNNEEKYSGRRRVFIHEEGSSDLANALIKLQPRLQPGNIAKIYLLISSSQKEWAQRAVKDSGMSMFKLDSFWPHLSTEALPDFTKYCFNPTFIFYKNCQVLHFWEYLDKIKEMCRLDVYELDVVPVADTAVI